MAIEEGTRVGWLAYMDVYGFSSMVEKANNAHIAETLLAIHKKAEDKLETLDHFQFFSDSIFLFKAHETTLGGASEESFMAVLDVARAIINAAVRQNMFLRGSLSFGEVVIRPNIILGKPILRAYRREQTLRFPVVIVPESELDAGGVGQILPVHAIETKDGLVSAAPILPHSRTGYIAKIQSNLREIAKTGPDQVALGWQGYLEFVEKMNEKLKGVRQQ